MKDTKAKASVYLAFSEIARRSPAELYRGES